jgi:hypothetical protein
MKEKSRNTSGKIGKMNTFTNFDASITKNYRNASTLRNTNTSNFNTFDTRVLPGIGDKQPEFFHQQYKQSSIRGPYFDPVRVEFDRNRIRAEE